MSSITRCDFCKKALKGDKAVRVYKHYSFISQDLCLKCWLEPKNWPSIHQVKDGKK